jgi:predicted MFS family arabinose efflux permease
LNQSVSTTQDLARSRPQTDAAEPYPLGRGLVLLIASACGLSAANLYYAQPLLDTIARAFGVGSGTAGLIVTLGQVGYAVGLGLLVPIGDLIAPRRLVPTVLILTTGSLVVSALAPSVGVLMAIALLVGLGSVGAQILVPFAATLAGDERRGQVIGTVMSGLLLGILLARTLSGLVAAGGNWRAVYWVAAGIAAVLAVVLARALPETRPHTTLRYGGLLRSTLQLVRDHSLLRRRIVFGALGMAAFSAFWTTLAFLLAKPPYNYSDLVIGLFGLVGAAGALCATFAGRFADRGHQRAATAVFSTLLAASYAVLWFGRASVVWLIIGIVLLDIGVQGVQVTNQSLIYAIAPSARSRITSAYMVMYFTGGALGSAVGAHLYAGHGWAGVCWLGVGIGVAAMLAWVYDVVRPIRSRGTMEA